MQEETKSNVSPSSEASTIQSTLVDAQVVFLKNKELSAISNPTIVITENTFTGHKKPQAGEVSDPSSVVDEVLNYINNHKIGHMSLL